MSSTLSTRVASPTIKNTYKFDAFYKMFERLVTDPAVSRLLVVSFILESVLVTLRCRFNSDRV